MCVPLVPKAQARADGGFGHAGKRLCLVALGVRSQGHTRRGRRSPNPSAVAAHFAQLEACHLAVTEASGADAALPPICGHARWWRAVQADAEAKLCSSAQFGHLLDAGAQPDLRDPSDAMHPHVLLLERLCTGSPLLEAPGIPRDG